MLDGAQFTRLRDETAMAGNTVYQYLFHKEDNDYGMDYDRLEHCVIDCASIIGMKIRTLGDTAGLECDQQVYTNLGGATDSLVNILLPLRQKETGKRFALTTRPDDDMLLAKLDSAYPAKDYVVTICSPMLWKRLYGLYIEPLLLESLSATLSNIDTNVTDTVIESEARKFYVTIINAGLHKRASDLHIVPCTDHAEVKFRVDGVQHHYINVPKDILEKICNILKNDGKMSVQHPSDPVDGKVRYSPSQGQLPDDYIDLRVSIIPSKKGPSLNIRYLSSKLYSFEELGMTADNINNYKEILSLPSGLVIQTGPTGSGKSTTLYAGLSYVHRDMRNIITVEDPVEILMDGIIQIDVANDSRLNFASALKASLRHDPDVIVVGELRDAETAALAVRAANTGHLVLTSLHTNDSVGAFERLVNLDVDSYSIGEVVAAVMGQRLVRRLCPHCKEEYKLYLKSDEAKLYRLPNKDEHIMLFRPKGCVACNNTGFIGRVAINEILVLDAKLRNMIQRHATRATIEEYLRETKFRTMYHDGIEKVMDGITSLSEMTKFAKDTIAFKG